MSAIVIVDTSVLLNVLDVPAFNQDRDEILTQFRELLDSGASFLLPMAAIFEYRRSHRRSTGRQAATTLRGSISRQDP